MKIRSFTRGYALGLVVLALTGLNMAPAAAATLSFVKFEGVLGESTRIKHEGETDLTDWNFSVRHVAQGVGACASLGGCTVFDDATITNVVERSTPVLFGKLANGEIIPSARISVERSGDSPKVFFSLLFTDVLLSAMNVGASGAGNVLVHTAFSFSTVLMSYAPQKPDGSLGTPITAFYDVANGEGSLPQLLTLFALAQSDNGVSAVPVPPALPMLAVAAVGMLGLRRRAARA